MSSIDFVNKVVIVTDHDFIGLSKNNEWLTELRGEGYQIKDFRKPSPEKRRVLPE